MCSVRRKHSVASLFYIKMEMVESLWEFMNRFSAMILQLESISIDTVMQAVKARLKISVSMDISVLGFYGYIRNISVNIFI